jgi:hypothetical protein
MLSNGGSGSGILHFANALLVVEVLPIIRVIIDRMKPCLHD